MKHIGLDGCPKADAMLRQVDPYGMTQREGGLSGPPQYGWAQRRDGDWEFRDPAIPNLAYLKSRGAWLSTTVPPEFTVPNPQVCPPIRNRVDVRGMTDFVLGGDGQVTAERGLHFLQPLQPFVVSEGGLTVSSLYGAAQSPRAHDYEFHLSNPHLHGVDPAAPIPAGTRVYVPHRWTANLRGAGYGVHRPTQTTGIGRLGTAASLATSIAMLQAINGATITPDGHDPLGAVTYGTYVQSQQSGGQLAINMVSPDVEITLTPAIAHPFTQQAWVLNGQLAAVNQTGTATIDDANQARTLLAAIIQQYINAANAVVAATPLAPSPNVDAPHVPVPTAPGVPTPRASASAQQLTAPSPGASPAAMAVAAAAAAKAVADKAAADKAAADKAAGTISTPWIIGGVVGGAAVLGLLVAIIKKKKS